MRQNDRCSSKEYSHVSTVLIRYFTSTYPSYKVLLYLQYYVHHGSFLFVQLYALYAFVLV